MDEKWITFYREKAKQNWLGPTDLLNLFDHIDAELSQSDTCGFFDTEIPRRPSFGSLFIISNSTGSKWKKDGYLFEKRNSGKGYKETSEKIGANKLITCRYSSISRDDEIYLTRLFSTSNINDVLQRRIFSKTEKTPAYYIVQYYFKRSQPINQTTLNKQSKLTNQILAKSLNTTCYQKENTSGIWSE